jgi:hypothetical protein
MPSVVLTKQYCDPEPTVVQRAYEWYFPSHLQQIQPDPGFAYEVLIAVALDAQFEMFPPAQFVYESHFVFRRLVNEWRSERGATSSTIEMVLCPAYQSIIGMGPTAIPLILAELAAEGDHPDHWFWALQAMTGANPVSDEDEGNLRRMSAAWLKWAASQGYAW